MELSVKVLPRAIIENNRQYSVTGYINKDSRSFFGATFRVDGTKKKELATISLTNGKMDSITENTLIMELITISVLCIHRKWTIKQYNDAIKRFINLYGDVKYNRRNGSIFIYNLDKDN